MRKNSHCIIGVVNLILSYKEIPIPHYQLPIKNIFPIFKMEEIYNFGKTVIRKLLVLVFQKTKGNFTDKRGPSRVAAERTNDAVTSRERI